MNSKIIVGLLLIVGCDCGLYRKKQLQFEALGWKRQESRLTASLRGISVVDNDVVWISGSEGRYAITENGGTTWRAGAVVGADSLDFRDVEAFSARLAYLMSAGPGDLSRIYKTEDGGKTWTQQHTNDLEEGFYDGFDFWNEKEGILVGDPINSKLFLLKTVDGGKHWQRISPDRLPPLRDGEYGFAASGTGIKVFQNHVWIGTGGSEARVFHSSDRGEHWDVFSTPIVSGQPSAGIFSIDFRDAKNGVVVGGDYTEPHRTGATTAYTDDGGKTWLLPVDTNAISYRSCVQYLPNSTTLVAVGRGGVSSYSNDDGQSWTTFGDEALYTLSVGKEHFSVWAAGPEGSAAKLLIALEPH